MSPWLHHTARGLALAGLLGMTLACAPRPTEAKEEDEVKASETAPKAADQAADEAAAGDGASDNAGFTAAHARFTAEARKAAGGSAVTVVPTAPDDRQKDYGALRTGAFYPFRASRDGKGTALVGFASPDAAAYVPSAVVDAIREGKAVDQDAPGFAALFAAAGLGTADSIGFADVLARLKHAFHFGNVMRLCPMKREQSPVRVRFRLKMSGSSPNTPRGTPRTVPSRETWVTFDYDATAGTARLSTGDEGC